MFAYIILGALLFVVFALAAVSVHESERQYQRLEEWAALERVRAKQ